MSCLSSAGQKATKTTRDHAYLVPKTILCDNFLVIKMNKATRQTDTDDTYSS